VLVAARVLGGSRCRIAAGGCLPQHFVHKAGKLIQPPLSPPRKHYQEKRQFNEKFVRVEVKRLCELTSGADALKMRSVVDLASRQLARMIEGKSPEQIRSIFNLPDDLTEEEKLEPIRNVGEDARIRLLNRLYAKKRQVRGGGGGGRGEMGEGRARLQVVVAAAQFVYKGWAFQTSPSFPPRCRSWWHANPAAAPRYLTHPH